MNLCFKFSFGVGGVPSGLMAIFVFLFVLAGVACVALVAAYLLRGFGILKMSNERGLSGGFLGLIPIASEYQLGKIAGEIELGNKRIDNTGLWLVLSQVIVGAVASIGSSLMTTPFAKELKSMGNSINESDFIKLISKFLIAFIIFFIFAYAAQIFLYLIRGLALHKLFSLYNLGQKPVFYLILAMFVPLAEPILLYLNAKKAPIGINEI